MNTTTNFFAVLQLPAGWWKKLVLFGLAAFFINVGVDLNAEIWISGC